MIRCTRCHAEFTDEQLAALGNVCACPACGCPGVPMDTAQDVTLPINWHELRILTIWASNYAERHCDDDGRLTLHAILKRLDRHRPKGAAALTLVGEIKEMQQTFPTAGLYDGEGNCIVPPREDPPTENPCEN